MTDKQQGDIIDFPDNPSIETQAAQWLAILDGDAPSQQDRQAFTDWVNKNPAHRQAFEELLNFWDEMNVLTQTVLPREQQPVHRPGTAECIANFFASARGMASAFILVAITITLSSLMLGPSTQDYITRVGEQRSIELADGSRLLINTGSHLQVAFSEQRRRIHLLKGEAHFEVAHNPARPFEVYAGKGLVRAIGTAFSIHIRKMDVEVIVTEGVVEMDKGDTASQSADHNNQPTKVKNQDPQNKLQSHHQTPMGRQPFKVGLTVDAGTMLTYDRGVLNQVELAVAEEIEKQLSWHQGLLVFDNEPLATVVAEVGRYTAINIIIPERAVRELKVGGLFKVGDIEALFEALREGFGIRAQWVSKDEIHLVTGKPNGAT